MRKSRVKSKSIDLVPAEALNKVRYVLKHGFLHNIIRNNKDILTCCFEQKYALIELITKYRILSSKRNPPTEGPRISANPKDAWVNEYTYVT